MKHNNLWWSKKWGKDKICGITHSRLRPGKNSDNIPYTITLPCKHSFYTRALIEWVNRCLDSKTCPICRSEFILQF